MRKYNFKRVDHEIFLKRIFSFRPAAVVWAPNYLSCVSRENTTAMLSHHVVRSWAIVALLYDEIHPLVIGSMFLDEVEREEFFGPL